MKNFYALLEQLGDDNQYFQMIKGKRVILFKVLVEPENVFPTTNLSELISLEQQLDEELQNVESRYNQDRLAIDKRYSCLAIRHARPTVKKSPYIKPEKKKKKILFVSFA